MAYENRQKALDYLLEIANDHGYVVVDEIIDATDEWDLSICDVDWLSSTIASYGILIYESMPHSTSEEPDDYNDYAQSDYEELFNNVIQLEPALEQLIIELRQIKPAQYKELSRIIVQARDGNEYARNRLIEVHLRAAVRLAYQRAIQFDADIIDCLGNSFVGLLNAVKRYDPDRNGPFGSYATMWMIQCMSREQPTRCQDVYYPVHKKDPYFIAYPYLQSRGCVHCDQLFNCEKAKKMVSEILDCDQEQAAEIIKQSLPWQSIEEMCSCSNDFEDVLLNSGSYVDDSDLLAKCNEFTMLLNEALAQLSKKEEYVLRCRLGIDNETPMTLEAIASVLGVTRERVRQIEGKAKNKLEKSPLFKKIEGLFD